MQETHIGWKKYNHDIHKLARRLKENQPYEFITGIARGGLLIAVHLSHLLNIEYFEINDFDNNISLLVCDDVSDSGKTLRDEVGEHYDTATLYRKDATIYEPTYCVETINKWIVFPWEE